MISLRAFLRDWWKRSLFTREKDWHSNEPLMQIGCAFSTTNEGSSGTTFGSRNRRRGRGTWPNSVRTSQRCIQGERSNVTGGTRQPRVGSRTPGSGPGPQGRVQDPQGLGPGPQGWVQDPRVGSRTPKGRVQDPQGSGPGPQGIRASCRNSLT